MLTLSGCIVSTTEEAQWQWKWTKACCYLESTVWVIQICVLGLLCLLSLLLSSHHFSSYFSFALPLRPSVTFGTGVSDSFGEVRVYPHSISPQLAALLCQESFTLQKTCIYTWGVIWVWLSLSVIAAARPYRSVLCAKAKFSKHIFSRCGGVWVHQFFL